MRHSPSPYITGLVLNKLRTRNNQGNLRIWCETQLPVTLFRWSKTSEPFLWISTIVRVQTRDLPSCNSASLYAVWGLTFITLPMSSSSPTAWNMREEKTRCTPLTTIPLDSNCLPFVSRIKLVWFLSTASRMIDIKAYNSEILAIVWLWMLLITMINNSSSHWSHIISDLIQPQSPESASDQCLVFLSAHSNGSVQCQVWMLKLASICCLSPPKNSGELSPLFHTSDFPLYYSESYMPFEYHDVLLQHILQSPFMTLSCWQLQWWKYKACIFHLFPATCKNAYQLALHKEDLFLIHAPLESEVLTLFNKWSHQVQSSTSELYVFW